MFDSPFSKDFKNRKVKMKFREDIEPHEVLLDKLARKKEEEWGLSEQKFETPLLKQILDGLFFVSIFLFFLLFAKTFQLGVIEGGNLSAQAEENKYIFHKIQAERGVIYDRNFNQLVSNQPSFDLICVKNDLPQEDSEKNRVFKEVSQVLKLEIEDLEKKIRNPENKNPQVSVFEGLSHQNLIVLETKITSGNLPGFQIENSTTRYYEDGVIFSHLIGYTGKIKTEELKATPGFYSINDYVGRAGIENFYEEALRKSPGEFRIERDALGNVIATEVVSLPEPGNSLVLSMDAGLQKKLQEELEKELKAIGVKRAAAVALDPRTGGVLSLVSLPSFDNNLFNKGADPKSLNKLLEDPYNLQPLFNRAISGGYLVGSTIKPLVASAALEEKIVSPQKKIDCEGLITIPNLWDPSLPTIKKDNAIHGWTDLRKALAESCNVFFYTIGGGYKDQTGLGPTKIK